jgi:formamidopyrimidine-DNA glycosylase
MPELPEVETIRLGLQKYVVGKKIEDVEVRLSKMLTGDPKEIIGAKVIDVRRFGKGLVIDLSNKYSIAIHIKLTGQLIYQDEKVSKVSKVSKGKVGTVPNEFTHLIFHLNKNAKLYFNDQRQFGWIRIIKSSKLKDQSFFKDLGPEPPVLSDYSSGERSESRSFSSRQARTILTPELFKQILSRSNLAIKVLIMDQKKMSGVGNIYANDALFEAKIDPIRKAKDLSDDEIKKLYDAILKVLKKGLESGGASERSFVNVLGQDGGYQKHFLVYGREKEKCKRCGGEIKKIKLGGRGTYFCANCQK